MNDTLDGIASTPQSLKPPVWNVAKIQAAICMLASGCVSLGVIAWTLYAFW